MFGVGAQRIINTASEIFLSADKRYLFRNHWQVISDKAGNNIQVHLIFPSARSFMFPVAAIFPPSSYSLPASAASIFNTRLAAQTSNAPYSLRQLTRAKYLQCLQYLKNNHNHPATIFHQWEQLALPARQKLYPCSAGLILPAIAWWQQSQLHRLIVLSFFWKEYEKWYAHAKRPMATLYCN